MKLYQKLNNMNNSVLAAISKNTVPKTIFGFVVPSSLELLKHSITPAILGIITSLLINLYIYLKNLTNYLKIFSILCLAVGISLSLYHYYELKNFNYDKNLLINRAHEIDLSKITKEELQKYKLIQIKSSLSKTIKINDAKLVSRKVNFKALASKKITPDDLAKRFNLTKNDRIFIN